MSNAALARLRLSAVALATAIGSFAVLGLAGAANAATFHVSTTKQLEEAVTTANGNAQANTIELAGGEVYLPSKTLVISDTSGIQTVTGPAGSLTIESPEAKLEGTNVQEVAGVSEEELFNVKKSVTLDLNHVIVTTGGREGSSAIEDLGTLNVEQSTIAGNLTTGILVHTGAKATIINSTISDGLSQGIADEGTATLQNDTVVRNAGSGIGGTGVGHLSITNTMIAENGAPQCGANTFSLNDHSLASDESCGATEFKNTNPKLSELLENDGGSTTVHSELPGSPTIAKGDSAHCPATDQRGYTRTAVECDIGADQFFNKAPTLTVPPHLLKEEAAGAGPAVLTYTTEATATGGVATTVCTNPSGSSFVVGVTHVTCTATDGHENKTSKSFEAVVTEALTGLSVGAIATTPSGLAVNSAGDIWVSSWSSNTVKEFSPAGAVLHTATLSSPCTGTLSGPYGLALDAEGNLWVADSRNNRILQLNSTGTCLHEFGGSGTGPHQFNYPTGVAIAPNGNVWVSDMFNQRVQDLTKTGEFVRQFGTVGSFGSGSGQLLLPQGVAVDASGHVWVSEPFNGRVQEFSETGTAMGTISAKFPEGQAVAIDPAGRVWIADGSNTVREFNQGRELLMTLGAEGTGEGQLRGPAGMTVASTGDVWVADQSPGRVEKWVKAADPPEGAPPKASPVGRRGSLRTLHSRLGR
jgi:sugar lactone lactonase YvrE